MINMFYSDQLNLICNAVDLIFFFFNSISYSYRYIQFYLSMRIDSNRNLRLGIYAARSNAIGYNTYISIDAFIRDWACGADFLWIHWAIIDICCCHIVTRALILPLITSSLLYFFPSSFVLLLPIPSSSRLVSFSFFFFINFVIIDIEWCGTVKYWDNITNNFVFILRNLPNMTNDHGLLQPCCCFSSILFFVYIQVSFERIYLIDSNTFVLHALAIRIEIWNELLYI